MEPGRSSRDYLPSLDGWRAFAILLVLLDHAAPFRSAALHRLQGRGNSGVWLFFAISGLLISTRLLTEEQRKGRISLGNFYLRRIFRILPPAVVYLLVIALLAGLRLLPWNASPWVASLLFYRNYWGVLSPPTAASWFTGHFWSLSVEEHFYLLIPAILALFPATRKKIVALGVLGLFLLNLLSFRIPALASWVTSDQRTEFCFEGLLVAALYAICLRNEAVRTWMTRYLHPAAVIPCGFLLMALHPPLIHNKSLEFFLIVSIRSVVNPLLLLSTILHSRSLATRLLELRPIKFVGQISYSLYLWQSLFLTQNWVYGGLLHRLQNPVVGIICTFVCAVLSYRYVEQPFIRYGQTVVARRGAVRTEPLEQEGKGLILQ